MSVNQNDGLNVWIKQTLQDELTGAEFSKLESVLESNYFRNSDITRLKENISNVLEGSTSYFYTDEVEAINELIEKSKEILLEQIDGLSADNIREICEAKQETESDTERRVGGFTFVKSIDDENNAIAIMKFFLAGKEFRTIKEWLDSSTNEIENELLEKITTTLKKGLEVATDLLVLVGVGGHHLDR